MEEQFRELHPVRTGIDQVITILMEILIIQLIGLMQQMMQVMRLYKIIVGVLIIKLIRLNQIYRQTTGQMLMA